MRSLSFVHRSFTLTLNDALQVDHGLCQALSAGAVCTRCLQALSARAVCTRCLHALSVHNQIVYAKIEAQG
jgi:hypothetical protein